MIGLNAEFTVARQACERGSVLAAHRLKSPYGEIDLVFESAHGLELVEVKSLGRFGLAETRVSARQKYRLGNVLLWVQSKFGRPARLHLAIVQQSGRVTWIPDFLG